MVRRSMPWFAFHIYFLRLHMCCWIFLDNCTFSRSSLPSERYPVYQQSPFLLCLRFSGKQMAPGSTDLLGRAILEAMCLEKSCACLVGSSIHAIAFTVSELPPIPSSFPPEQPCSPLSSTLYSSIRKKNIFFNSPFDLQI